MKLKVVCPQCSSQLIIPSHLAGQSIRCSECKFEFQVRAVQAASEQTIESGIEVNEPATAPIPVDAAAPSTASDSDADTLPKLTSENRTSSGRRAHEGVMGSTDAKKLGASRVSPDEKVGRFKVESLLGSGGFGDVYCVYDPLLDRRAALKVMRSGPSTQDRMERVLQEAKASARLRHPNIVSVYEVGQDEGRAFIASQFVPGVTLAERLSEFGGVVTDDEQRRDLVGWLIELCQALDYAHQEQIVHRDVKPHNVLIDEESRAQLTDFGLARQITRDSDGVRQLAGTPAYMSPEQVNGDVAKIGPASDQYAVGVILYESLVGQRPFEGDSASLLSSIVHDEIPSPTSVNSSIPRPLEMICLKALSRDANQRYSDCQALADDLQRWLDGELVLATNPSWVSHTIHWARQRPHLASWLIAMAALFLVACGTTLTLGLNRLKSAKAEISDQKVNLASVRSDDKQKAEIIIQREQKIVTLEIERETIKYARIMDGGTRVVETDDVAKVHRMLDRVSWGNRGIEHSLLRRRAMGTPIVLHAGSPIENLSWSADSTLLLAMTRDRKVRLWDGVNYQPLTTATFEGLDLVEFHPRRSELVTLHRRSYDAKSKNWIPAMIRQWKVDRTRNGIVLKYIAQQKSELEFFHGITFNPERNFVAVCGQGGAEIYGFGETLKRITKPKNLPHKVDNIAYSRDGQHLDCLIIDDDDYRLFRVDAKNRDGKDVTHSIGSPTSKAAEMPSDDGLDPTVVAKASLHQAIDQAFPQTRYAGGKVMVFDGTPFQRGKPLRAKCAIETANGKYFAGLPDGKVLDDNIVRIGHLSNINCLAMRTDRACVASGDEIGEIRVWPTSSQTPEGARCSVDPTQPIPSGNRIVSNTSGRFLTCSLPSFRNTLVTIWDSQTGAVMFELDGHMSGIPALDFHPSRSELMTVDGSGVFRVWELVNSNQGTKVLRRWKSEHVAYAQQLTFDNEGDQVLVLGSQPPPPGETNGLGTAVLMDPDTGSVIHELVTDSDAHPLVGAFVPDSKRVVVSFDDGTVRQFSTDNGKQDGDFETDNFIAIDLDATKERLVAVLAEPCVLNSIDAGVPYENLIRCWSTADRSKNYSVFEDGVTFCYLDIDQQLGRILAPAGDGYRILDLKTGERLWTDYRYPAHKQFQEMTTTTYTVQIPVTEQREQTYQVCVPYTETLHSVVEVPFMETKTYRGTVEPKSPNSVRGLFSLPADCDAIVQGKVLSVKDEAEKTLLSPKQIQSGVFLKPQDDGTYKFFSDSAHKQPIELELPEDQETELRIEIQMAVTKTRSEVRQTEVTKTRAETRTRIVEATKIVHETRTRSLPLLKSVPLPFASGKAIFLPNARGVAVSSPTALYVVSAGIPSSPQELVGTQCHYEMLATNANGSMVAAAGQTGNCGSCGCDYIDIWSTEKGIKINTIRLRGASAGDIAFAPDTGNLLVGLQCRGERTIAAPPGVAPVNVAAPIPVAVDEADQPYEGACLLIFDPKEQEPIEQISGVESIRQIATSRNAENPETLLVDTDNQIHRLRDGNKLESLTITVADQSTLMLSPDGRIFSYLAVSGNTNVALTSNATSHSQVPEQWTQASYSWNGQELVVKRNAESTIVVPSRVTMKHELLCGSWTVDEIVKLLSQRDPPKMLPGIQRPEDAWVLTGHSTTPALKPGMRVVRPLHSHSSLSEHLSVYPTGQPLACNGQVFAIGDTYHGLRNNHNHIIVWKPTVTEPARFATLPVQQKTILLARANANACGAVPCLPTFSRGKEDTVVPDIPFDAAVTSVKGPVYQMSPDYLFVYAPPGRDFKLKFDVHYKASQAAKLAANLRQLPDIQKLLSESQVSRLRKNHSTTHHFDTQSREGYSLAEGEGQIRFTLMGSAPSTKGVFDFRSDVGLFNRRTWSTLNQKWKKIVLVTDQQRWNRASLQTIEQMDRRRNAPAAGPPPAAAPVRATSVKAPVTTPAHASPQPAGGSTPVQEAPLPVPAEMPPAPIPDKRSARAG